MGIAIVTIVMIFESVILLAIATYKIIDAMVNKESAKEKEERLLEKLLQQSESTQRHVESFWSLLRDLLSEIRDEHQCQTEHPVHGCGQCQKVDSEEE